jgi:hypothetical protein
MQSLYLMKCQNFYKIGVANDVESRLSQLSTGNPFPITVEVIYEFENAEPIERALHQRYKSVRQRGEWFELEYQDTIEIHKVCLALGGRAWEYRGNEVTNSAIEDAEELAEPVDGVRFDYAAMFADGWCMDMAHDGKIKDGGERKYNYWAWRKRKLNEKGYIYGGKISDLPYPSLEEMRRVYRDGLEPLAQVNE